MRILTPGLKLRADDGPIEREQEEDRADARVLLGWPAAVSERGDVGAGPDPAAPPFDGAFGALEGLDVSGGDPSALSLLSRNADLTIHNFFATVTLDPAEGQGEGGFSGAAAEDAWRLDPQGGPGIALPEQRGGALEAAARMQTHAAILQDHSWSAPSTAAPQAGEAFLVEVMAGLAGSGATGAPVSLDAPLSRVDRVLSGGGDDGFPAVGLGEGEATLFVGGVALHGVSLADSPRAELPGLGMTGLSAAAPRSETEDAREAADMPNGAPHAGGLVWEADLARNESFTADGASETVSVGRAALFASDRDPSGGLFTDDLSLLQSLDAPVIVDDAWDGAMARILAVGVFAAGPDGPWTGGSAMAGAELFPEEAVREQGSIGLPHIAEGSQVDAALILARFGQDEIVWSDDGVGGGVAALAVEPARGGESWVLDEIWTRSAVEDLVLDRPGDLLFHQQDHGLAYSFPGLVNLQ